MRTLSRIAIAGLIGIALPAATLHAAGAKPVAITPDQLKWAPNPDAPGVMTAVISGDPAKGAHAAFHKFVPGFTTPLHTHSGNLEIIVIAGTLSMTGEDGKEMKFPAGSYYTQPNTTAHITKCLEGAECLAYVHDDARWDLKPVAAVSKK